MIPWPERYGIKGEEGYEALRAQIYACYGPSRAGYRLQKHNPKMLTVSCPNTHPLASPELTA